MSRYNPLLQDEYLFGKRIEDFDYVKRVDEQAEERSGKKVLVVAAGSKIFAIEGKKIKKIAERDSQVWVLYSYGGKLYDGGKYNAVYETLSNRVVAERNGWISALCSYEGIYETFTGKSFQQFDHPVHAMSSVDREVVGL